jgi:hypothetical protein
LSPEEGRAGVDAAVLSGQVDATGQSIAQTFAQTIARTLRARPSTLQVHVHARSQGIRTVLTLVSGGCDFRCAPATERASEAVVVNWVSHLISTMARPVKRRKAQ